MNTPDSLPFELQVLGSVVLLAFLGWLVRLVRAQKVSLRDSLLWFLSTIIALIVTLFPQLLARAARAVDVQVPSNALFGAAIVYLAVNLLSSTIANSINAANIRRLTQDCALLRGELEALARAQASASAGVAAARAGSEPHLDPPARRHADPASSG
jgi:hypothetical protein